MFRKTHIIWIALLLNGLMLSGCWDSGEIENLNKLSLVIVDFNEGQYSFYVEMANVLGSNKTDEGKADYSILIATDDSLIGARDQLNRSSDHPVYLGASRAVVFTQSMAELGLEEYMNRIRSEKNYRKTISLFTTQSDPLKMIKHEPENSRSVGDSLESTSEALKEMDQTISVTVGDVLQILEIKGVGFLLPQVDLKEEDNRLTGYTVFKNSKCIGVIPAEERKGTIFLLTKNPEFYYEVYDDDRHYIINVAEVKKQIKPSLIEEQVTFEVDLSFEYEIQYMDKMKQLSKEQEEQMKKKLTNKIESDISQAIKASQRTYRCDYLEFYKYFKMHYLNEFKQMDWEDQYAQAIIKININGELTESSGLEVLSKETNYELSIEK